MIVVTSLGLLMSSFDQTHPLLLGMMVAGVFLTRWHWFGGKGERSKSTDPDLARATEYLNAIELGSSGHYAWKEAEEDEGFVTASADQVRRLGEILGSGINPSLTSVCGTRCDHPLCAFYEDLTCMPFWWSPDRRKVCRVVDERGVTHCWTDQAKTLAEYPARWKYWVYADVKTGDELPCSWQSNAASSEQLRRSSERCAELGTVKLYLKQGHPMAVSRPEVAAKETAEP